MILSHRHKYIFIHCRKTAGSSICVSLARSLGPNDLQLGAIIETLENDIPLTEFTKAEARRGSLSVALKYHFVSHLRIKRSFSRAMKKRYRAVLGPKPQHATAARIAQAFPAEWAEYQKFCVVRNPWDKTVSDYFWRTNNLQAPPEFSQYVSALSEGRDLGGVVPVSIHSNWEMYTLDDRVAVDHIVRYENLVDDLKKVTAEIGLSWDGWLPRAKGTFRKTGHYRDMYDETTRKLVASIYEREIDEFGYQF